MLDPILDHLAEEHHRHPWIVPGILVSASAALGARLTEIIVFVAAHPWHVVAAMTPLCVMGAASIVGLVESYRRNR